MNLVIHSFFDNSVLYKFPIKCCRNKNHKNHKNLNGQDFVFREYVIDTDMVGDDYDCFYIGKEKDYLVTVSIISSIEQFNLMFFKDKKTYIEAITIGHFCSTNEVYELLSKFAPDLINQFCIINAMYTIERK